MDNIKTIQKRTEGKWNILILFLVLLILIGFSILAGRYSITPAMLKELIFSIGKPMNEELESASIVLLNGRIARIAAAILIGASLSAAGASYQGTFQNPLVSPDLLGAGTGAAFGAALAFLCGAGAVLTQLSAFFFGLIAVAATYFVSSFLSEKDGSETLTLVLTGMVVASLFSAFVSIIKFIGDPYDILPSITFWLMGGLTYVTTSDVVIMLIPFFAGIIPLMLIRWNLNVLSLTDEESSALGLNTKTIRGIVIICATLMTSSAMAVGGMIGWVGLIVPHISRMLAGPDYTRMLPCSVICGSIFLLLVDDIARCLLPQEIPLGVLTAIIGAPFFLYLMFRGKRSFL